MSQGLSKYEGSLFRDNDFLDNFFNYRFPAFFDDHKGIFKFPKINISDDDQKVIVTANIPGIKADDITIDVDDNQLTIKGSSKREEEEGKEDSDFYRFEREEGSFARTVTLPSSVDKSRVDAKTKNGVLTIILPKIEKREDQKITIREE